MILPFLFLLGLAIGSFLNVTIDRLPHDRSVNGRSSCDYCHKTIAWYDLIPVVSFILLRGKCRYCHKKLSWQYPIVELLTGTIYILIYIWQPISTNFNQFQRISTIYYLLSYLGIISCLIVIFFTDAKYHIIPDTIQIALFIFAVILFPQNGMVLSNFLDKVVGAVVVAAPIFFLNWVTKGKGMGFGDVKLSFIIGLLLGIKAGFIALYIAFVTGAATGIIFILLGERGLKSKIAFGPFLVIGILTMLFWKAPVVALINRLYGF